MKSPDLAATLSDSIVPGVGEPRIARIRAGVAALCAMLSIPMSFAFYVLPATLRQSGLGPEFIGLVWVVYLPFVLRLLWAPLIDRMASRRPEAYRRIVLGAAVAGLLALLPLFQIDPARDVGKAIGIMALAIALFATGFTALDGYVISAMGREGRNQVAAFQAVGYALGGVIFGLGSIAIDGWGWPWLVAFLVAATLIAALPLFGLPAKFAAISTAESLESSVSGWRFLASRAARWRVLVAVLGHTGLGLNVGYLTVLQVDAGLTVGQVGLFNAVGGSLCGLIAAGVAGLLLLRLGGWHCLALILAAGAVIFGACAALQHHLAPIVFAIVLSTISMILGFAYDVPFRGLALSISGGDRGATQAAIISSIDKIVAIVAAMFAGVVVNAVGLGGLLLISALACLCALPICLRAVADIQQSSINKSTQVVQ